MTDQLVRCKAICTGHNRCVLDGVIAHRLHICSAPDCECHSQARYEAARHEPEEETQEVEAVEMSDLKNPYCEGQAAHAEGRSERSNPYAYGSVDWSRWLNGHRAARKQEAHRE